MLTDAAQFVENQRAIASETGQLEAAQDRLQNDLADLQFHLRTVEELATKLDEELRSLRQRRSNIPSEILKLREKLCEGTGLAVAALPFAGELLQVREEESKWAGVIERLLRNFGLSLLVPDASYGRVAEWVNDTHLAGRLVYYRVREMQTRERPAIRPVSLVRKIQIKPESSFYNWLEAEVERRFDYACCDSMDQFRRETRAATAAGQVKGTGERHEKDDRHRIGDRSQFVLGWSNRAKIEALSRQADETAQRRELLVKKSNSLKSEIRKAQEKLNWLRRLADFQSFQDLDWKPLALQIEKLDRERQELERTSDVLRTLQKQLAGVEAAMQKAEHSLSLQRERRTLANQRLEDARARISECEEVLAGTAAEVQARDFALLERMRVEAIGEQPFALETVPGRERAYRSWLESSIASQQQRLNRLSEQIVGAMQKYRNEYPAETREVDASVAAAHEYESMLAKLQNDDLPRFESRFKQLLNENTIREVANFQSQLNREQQTIRERIEAINSSLHEIDFNPRRYIVLEAEPAADVEVRQFRSDLRACTEGALTGSQDEEYSEAKFLQVKQIIARFRGREGIGKIDERWKAKVTDVRQWFTFSASERWREDGREFEHYTDSGGKSGGQKEKLAYTVLAASLAYQFGLERGANRARSFRFVVIDEAFGRGSDESARFGLDLFRTMGLQLLIVTPLQKIHIIEPFVASVGFVHNEDGKHSRLRNLTIEEYRAERSARSSRTT